MAPERDRFLGEGLLADAGVQIGYQSDRSTSSGLRLGRNGRLRSGTVLYAGSRIGDGFQTGHNVVIREDSSVGNHVSVWSNSVIDYGCTIGDGVKIHSNCYVAQFSTLEDGVFLAPGVILTNDLYPGFAESAMMMKGPTIKNGAQVGAGAVILPFVTVGENSIIGAGSVVTRDVPSKCIAYGVPAMVISGLDEEAVKSRLAEIQKLHSSS